MKVVALRIFTKNLIDHELFPQEAISKEISYDSGIYGTPQEIYFIPSVKVSGIKKPILCVDDPTTVEKIDLC